MRLLFADAWKADPATSMSGWSSAPNYVDHGNPTRLNNVAQGTMCAWVYPTDATVRNTISSKAVGAAQVEFLFQGNLANDPWTFQVARATQAERVQANSSAFAYYGLSKWLFAAATFDLNTTANNRLFMGDELALAIEATSYTTQQTGSGAQSDDSSTTMQVGLRDGTNNDAWQGNLARLWYFQRVLTLPELHLVQRGVSLADGTQLLDCRYGVGPGAQLDRSPLAYHGAVTGTLSPSAFAPVVPSPKRWQLLFNAAAAAGGTNWGTWLDANHWNRIVQVP